MKVLGASRDAISLSGFETDADPSRLSFAQERLWFLSQLSPSSLAYNLNGAIRLRGRLNVRAIQKSIRSLVLRHETLHSRIVDDAGSPTRFI